MKSHLTILFIVCLNFYFSTQSQDLCGDAKTAGFTFAHDPSSCGGYLLCTYDTDGTFLKVEQKNCAWDNPEFPNFFEDSCYPNDPAAGGFLCDGTAGGSSDANYKVQVCPSNADLQTSTLMYAVLNADPTLEKCDEYNLCRDSAPPTPLKCVNELVFDRAHGICTDSVKAPCSIPPPINPGPDGNGPDCTNSTLSTTEIINLPWDGSCTKYRACFNGESLGDFECDEVFNTNIANCDHSINYTCTIPQSARQTPKAQPRRLSVVKRLKNQFNF